MNALNIWTLIITSTFCGLIGGIFYASIAGDPRPDKWTGTMDNKTMVSFRTEEQSHRLKIWNYIEAKNVKHTIDKEKLINLIHKNNSKISVLENNNLINIKRLNKIDIKLSSDISREHQKIISLEKEIEKLRK